AQESLLPSRPDFPQQRAKRREPGASEGEFSAFDGIAPRGAFSHPRQRQAIAWDSASYWDRRLFPLDLPVWSHPSFSHKAAETQRHLYCPSSILCKSSIVNRQSSVPLLREPVLLGFREPRACHDSHR